LRGFFPQWSSLTTPCQDVLAAHVMVPNAIIIMHSIVIFLLM